MYRKIMDELIGEQTITLLLSNGKEVKVNGVLKGQKTFGIAQFTYESSPKDRIKQAIIVSEAEIIGYTYNFEK